MQDQQFTKSLRLLTPKQFSRVFNRTQLRSGTKNLLVLASENDLGHARLGFVIAKKHLKRAVDRNRVKRLIRESFRHEQHRLLALDFVILARPGLRELDNQHIRAMIDPLWHRLKRSDHGRPKKQRSHP